MNANEYSYGYDPIGNRDQCIIVNGQLITTNGYGANSLNQYTNIINSQLSTINSFDLDGNMTFLPSTSGGGAGGEGWHCQWDAENRLLTASNLTKAEVCGFIYDHQSRRISKKVFNSSLITQHSSFTYDEWNMIYEQTSTNTSAFLPHTSSFYTWGLDLSGTLQGAGGVGGLLSQTIITPTAASSYFPLADANGNAVTYLDEAGNVQAHYTYDAFGGTVSQSGDMTDDFPFRFSSKYLDDETGLYYYGYRFYAPAFGRWINRDPFGENGGLLLYGFIGNDGVNFWDLLGQAKHPQSPEKAVPESQKDAEYWDKFWRNTIGPCLSQAGNTLTGSLTEEILKCVLNSANPYGSKNCIYNLLKVNGIANAACCIGHAYDNKRTPAHFGLYDRCDVGRCACGLSGGHPLACEKKYACCISAQNPNGDDTWN